MKYILLLVLTLFIAGRASAQTLEEVNFSTPTQAINTYVTDINNAGFVCGYYDTTGQTNGFVINPDGKICRFIGASGSSTKVEGINNNNVVVINYTISGVPTVYKAYYNSASQDYGSQIAVSNILESTAVPFGINNLNDIVGWYQGANERWVWVAHDSIVPSPNTAWMASRYGSSPYYNTQGGGINDNNLAVGFWFDANTINPVLYDVTANSFTPISNPPSTRCRLWDINNNQISVGEYRQANGVYCAFWAPVTTAGNFTMVHSMNTIFQSATIQSVANGINDKGEIVGSYVHPTTGTYVGFIYRPLANGYRLPGYDWQKHTWSMKNNTSSPNSVWTTNYYGSCDYRYSDPFSSLSTQPLFDTFMRAAYPGIDTHNYYYLCADWRSFAKEIDTGNILSTPNYQVWKHLNASKWINNSNYQSNFNGICYGFAFTSLMKWYNDSTLYNEFAIPLGNNLYSYGNSSNNEISAITRTYLKQYDNNKLTPYLPAKRYLVRPWAGLYRLKNTYQDANPVRRNPRAVYTKSVTGWHSLLPYKIKTPQTLPFNYNGVIQKDTLYIYDSNYPGDSTQYFLVNATTTNTPIDSAKNPSYPNLRQLCFNEASVQEMIPIVHAALKQTAIYRPDTTISVYMNPASSWYQASGGGGTASYNASGHNNTIPFLTEAEQKDENIDRPKYYNMDTTNTISVTTNNYIEGKMVWNMSNHHKSMGISRVAQAGESDNSQWNHRMMTYGTHDAATKDLSGYFMEMDDNLTQGVNILARNLSVANGDSLITSNPSRFVYKITRMGSTTDKYDVWVFTAGTDSTRQYRINGVTMTPNSTHTIVPYYGPGGTQVAILIDKHNTGTVDSVINVNIALAVPAQELPQGEIHIYPNPANKEFTVAFQGMKGTYEVRLLDYTGKNIYTKSLTVTSADLRTTIPLGNLASGIYLVSVKDESGRIVFTEKLEKH